MHELNERHTVMELWELIDELQGFRLSRGDDAPVGVYIERHDKVYKIEGVTIEEEFGIVIEAGDV